MPSPTTEQRWDVHRLPSAEGKNFLVTGGNAGIGYFVAEQLAGTGADVILGSRDAAKATAAVAAIRSRVPDARVRHLHLDLADPATLESSVDALGLDHLDALVCNAGVLLDHPRRCETRDGRELMFATNHLGHFTLTGRLAPLLSAAPAGRVVTTGSFVAKSARLDLDDLQVTLGYRPKDAYARSKLAQMLFGFELDRRLRAAGRTTASVVNPPAERWTRSPRPARRSTAGPPAGDCAGCLPTSSCRASTPPHGPRFERSWIRPFVAGSCGAPGCSDFAASPGSNRRGESWPTPRWRLICGRPASSSPASTPSRSRSSGRAVVEGVVVPRAHVRCAGHAGELSPPGGRCRRPPGPGGPALRAPRAPRSPLRRGSRRSRPGCGSAGWTRR